VSVQLSVSLAALRGFTSIREITIRKCFVHINYLVNLTKLLKLLKKLRGKAECDSENKKDYRKKRQNKNLYMGCGYGYITQRYR